MTSRAKLSRSSRSSRKQKRRAGSPSTARRVRQAALAEVKNDLSRFLRLAEAEEILITRHGKPAGVLIDRVLDQVLETGIPVEIERYGRRLRIVAEKSGQGAAPGKLTRLKARRLLRVAPEALVHVDWSREWRP